MENGEKGHLIRLRKSRIVELVRGFVGGKSCEERRQRKGANYSWEIEAEKLENKGGRQNQTRKSEAQPIKAFKSSPKKDMCRGFQGSVKNGMTRLTSQAEEGAASS